MLRSPASVKAAAKESLEMGKEAVKHSAESAARDHGGGPGVDHGEGQEKGLALELAIGAAP